MRFVVCTVRLMGVLWMAFVTSPVFAQDMKTLADKVCADPNQAAICASMRKAMGETTSAIPASPAASPDGTSPTKKPAANQTASAPQKPAAANAAKRGVVPPLDLCKIGAQAGIDQLQLREHVPDDPRNKPDPAKQCTFDNGKVAREQQRGLVMQRWSHHPLRWAQMKNDNKKRLSNMHFEEQAPDCLMYGGATQYGDADIHCELRDDDILMISTRVRSQQDFDAARNFLKRVAAQMRKPHE